MTASALTSTAVMTAASISIAWWLASRVALPALSRVYTGVPHPPGKEVITIIYDPRCMRVVRITKPGASAFLLPHWRTFCVHMSCFVPGMTTLNVRLQEGKSVRLTYHIQPEDVPRYLTMVGPQSPAQAMALTVAELFRSMEKVGINSEGDRQRCLRETLGGVLMRQHAVRLDAVDAMAE